MKLKNVMEGWGKALKLMQVRPEERERSEKRLTVCSTCPNAKNSTILKIINGAGHDMSAYYCNLCKCPVNEKSLVINETCPLGKWENL